MGVTTKRKKRKKDSAQCPNKQRDKNDTEWFLKKKKEGVGERKQQSNSNQKETGM